MLAHHHPEKIKRIAAFCLIVGSAKVQRLQQSVYMYVGSEACLWALKQKYSIKMRALLRAHSGTLAIIGGREPSVKQLLFSALNFWNKRKSSEGRFDQYRLRNQGEEPVARCALAWVNADKSCERGVRHLGPAGDAAQKSWDGVGGKKNVDRVFVRGKNVENQHSAVALRLREAARCSVGFVERVNVTVKGFLSALHQQEVIRKASTWSRKNTLQYPSLKKV